MKRLQRDAVILSLIEHLLDEDSWCGETHIQKAIYFMQELFNVPLEFEFILYKHGPFSFDLSNELTAMRADMLLKLQFQIPPYGPSLLPGERNQLLKDNFSVTREKYQPYIQFVARQFGKKGVAELERISTALFVTKEFNELFPDNDLKERAQCIVQLKPHVKINEAREAVKIVDEIIEKSREVQQR